MTYRYADLIAKKPEFTTWVENMAKDLSGLEENKEIKELFPGSENGDVATVKDLVGYFTALLTGKDVEIS